MKHHGWILMRRRLVLALCALTLTLLAESTADAWGWTTLHAIAVVTRLVALIWLVIELWVEPDIPNWYLATRKDS